MTGGWEDRDFGGVLCRVPAGGVVARDPEGRTVFRMPGHRDKPMAPHAVLFEIEETGERVPFRPDETTHPRSFTPLEIAAARAKNLPLCAQSKAFRVVVLNLAEWERLQRNGYFNEPSAPLIDERRTPGS